MATKEQNRSRDNMSNVSLTSHLRSPGALPLTRNALPRQHKAAAIAVAACFGATSAYANPTNPTVVNGAAQFTTTGNLLKGTSNNWFAKAGPPNS